MSYIEGALAEPLGVALHAVRLAQPRPEDEMIVLGAGIIGVCVLQVLRVRGVSRIGVVEPIEERRRFAEGSGSHHRLREADVVFECAGEGAAIEEALALARPAGKVIVVGIPHPERISFEANVPRRKELTLIFSRRSRDTLAEAIDLVATGAVDLRSIPIRQFSLDQAAEAIALTASRPGDMLRAVVLP
jgi:L-iditol 2-dehydrogenase